MNEKYGFIQMKVQNGSGQKMVFCGFKMRVEICYFKKITIIFPAQKEKNG